MLRPALKQSNRKAAGPALILFEWHIISYTDAQVSEQIVNCCTISRQPCGIFRVSQKCKQVWKRIAQLWSQVRQRLHGTGSVWNRYEIGTDKPCVYTRPGGSGTDRICYLVPNESTYEGEGDPMWNRTVPTQTKWIRTRVDPIPCKRSLNQQGIHC